MIKAEKVAEIFRSKIQGLAITIKQYKDSGNSEMINAIPVLENELETYIVAERALYKQIPQKAKPHKRIPGICKCPVCKVDLCTEEGKQIFCPDCGQAVIV